MAHLGDCNCALVDRLRLLVPLLQPIHPCEVRKVDCNVRVPRSEHRLVDRDRAFVRGFGLVELACYFVAPGEVVEIRRERRGRAPERTLVDADRSQIKRLRLVVAALVAIELREVRKGGGSHEWLVMSIVSVTLPSIRLPHRDEKRAAASAVDSQLPVQIRRRQRGVRVPLGLERYWN